MLYIDIENHIDIKKLKIPRKGNARAAIFEDPIFMIILFCLFFYSHCIFILSKLMNIDIIGSVYIKDNHL